MTKEQVLDSQAKNNVLDKVMQGAAAFMIAVLAFHEILRHIRATEPVNFLLAGIVVAFLLYLIFAPIFRK